MTQQHLTQAPEQRRVAQLPELKFPLLAKVLAQGPGGIVEWKVSGPHPEDQTATIRRMYIQDGAIEIYSDNAGPNQKSPQGVRDTLPWARVFQIQEVMPMDVYLEEMHASNEDESEDPEEPDEPEEPSEDQSASNGNIS